MGARFFLVAGSVGLVASAFLIQACGETESTPDTAGDSGADVAVDSNVADTAPPAEEDAATCDLSADLTQGIPDAAIADGASTSGLCLQCAKTKCAAQLDDCSQECACQELLTVGLDCYLKNTSNPLACAGNFTGVDQNTQQIGLALIGCISGGCKEECATESLLPNDAGSDADAN